MMHARTARRILMLCAGMALTLSSHATAAAVADSAADEVIANAIKAMGGKEAIERIESYASKSVMTFPMGEMKTHTRWGKGDKLFVQTTMPQMGEVDMGSDGAIGWMKNPMMGGYMLADDEQLEGSAGRATFHIKMLWLDKTMKEDFESVESVGSAEYNGKSCHKLRIVPKPDDNSGDEESFVYFDSSTGLPLGIESMEQTPQGAQQLSIIFEDWKTVGDVQLFYAMKVSGGGMEASMKYSVIEFNTVDPAVFELPDEVKALVEAAKDAPDLSEMSVDDFSPQAQQIIRQMLPAIESQTDPEALRQRIGSLESQAASLPGEFGKAMEFIVIKAKARLAEIEGH